MQSHFNLRILTLKALGFSWARISQLTGLTEAEARAAWLEAKDAA